MSPKIERTENLSANKREKMTEEGEFCASEGRDVGEQEWLTRGFSLRAERRND